jgi:hypothetical protein
MRIFVPGVCWQTARNDGGELPDLHSTRGRVFQLFKYVVYAFLTADFFVFFAEEWAALDYRFSDGVALAYVIEGFAASIDTAAWVILLLMFELETFILEDEQFTARVKWSLHGLRAFCYVFIIYAFYGYLSKLLFLEDSTLLSGVDNLCALTDGTWSYVTDLDEYAPLSATNCADLSAASAFYQLPGLTAVIDGPGLTDVTRLAWVDVINSAVWLLVVLVLEIDVRLQEKNKLDGLFLTASNSSKFILYSLLLVAAVYWGIKGDFVDFWDAFLWLVAFVFIELNVFDWRQESLEERQMTDNATV